MARFTYIDLISAIDSEETQNIIGKIDVNTLRLEDIESLYYIFPLIERIILEIYKLVPDADVEHYEQGIMKTVLSIIDRNIELDVLPENLINIIKKYYDGDCPRNRLFHVKNPNVNISVSFNELHYVIMHLLFILKRQISLVDKDNLFETISTL